MPGPGNILIKVGADAGQAVRELSTVNKSLGETMTHSEKMSATLSKAALPAAAALGAIGIAAIGATKAAAEDAAQQEHLAGVLERTAHATDAQVKSTEDWIAKTARATGVADDDLRPALESIVTATGDVSKSQKLMTQALDISAATGKDVETVSKAIAKAYQGHTQALARLVPGLSAGAQKSKDFAVIMAELQQKTGGAAAEAAGTAAGQFKTLTMEFGELQEQLGAVLLPVLDKLMPMLLQLSDFAQRNTTAITILVGVIAALSGAILVANAAMKVYAAAQLAIKAATAAWTAAQWLLNAALNANPIGAVILAVAALTAAIILAYRHSATFRAVVDEAFAAIKRAVDAVAGAFESLLGAASSAFRWITAHWQLALFAFGPIGAAVYAIVTNFHTLEAVAKSVAGAVSSAIRAIGDAIDYVVGKIKSLVDWLGRIHVPHIDLPGPFALAGAPAPAGLATSSSRSSSPITVNVYGAVDPEGTARAIRRVLAGSDRRSGRIVTGLY